ncbi:MAG: creatininase family protein [Actinomycetota bacterium]|nr:creatininase family protein [Actinomycetota bacterium]
MAGRRREVCFEEMFPWEIAAAMAEVPLCYLPLGTLEWHGEHAAVGLDALKAHAAVWVRAAQRSGGLVVPPLYWSTDWREDLPDDSYLTGGIERGEPYHVPGNMFWLRPETFHNLLLDIYEAMHRRGFRAIVVLSGHWSRAHNIPAIRESGEEFRRAHPTTGWLLLTDQEVVPELHYPVEHAAGGETSLLLAIRPDLVSLDKTVETDRSLRPYYAKEPANLRGRKETPHEYIGVNPGVPDSSNDPEEATIERGRVLLEAIVDRVATRARALCLPTDEHTVNRVA